MTEHQHPSNKLYNGQIADFENALKCYIESIEFEIAQGKKFGYKEQDFEEERKSIEFAGKVLAEYQSAKREFEENLFQSWDTNPDLAWLAKIGLNKSYHDLAI